jgi:hypothetical protein
MKRGSAARGVWGKYHTLYIAELQFRYDARLTRTFSERRSRDEKAKTGNSSWLFCRVNFLDWRCRMAIIICAYRKTEG